jgi:hypothetical protein
MHRSGAGAALELVTDAPEVWHMTVRHIEEMAN